MSHSLTASSSYLREDSNLHWTVFKTAASAIGLRRHSEGKGFRVWGLTGAVTPLYPEPPTLLKYPREDLNLQQTVSETAASTNWATRAKRLTN